MVGNSKYCNTHNREGLCRTQNTAGQWQPVQVYLIMMPQGVKLQRYVGMLSHAFWRLRHFNEISHFFGRAADGRQRSTIGTSQAHTWHGVISARLAGQALAKNGSI